MKRFFGADNQKWKGSQSARDRKWQRRQWDDSLPDGAQEALKLHSSRSDVLPPRQEHTLSPLPEQSGQAKAKKENPHSLVAKLSVVTDKADYAPGETVSITANRFNPGSTVEFVVEIVSGPGHDRVYGTADDIVDKATTDLLSNARWLATDGAASDSIPAARSIGTTWFVDPDALSTTLRLTATSYGADKVKGTADDRVAVTSFTDASGSFSKPYAHWSDEPLPGDWNNNILNDNKSNYFEGEVIPHVFMYGASNNTPLVNGQAYSFDVTYNWYQKNTDAGGFAYMTQYNLSRQPGKFDWATPAVSPTADVAFTNGGGMKSGSFYTVDANITNVSNVTYTGSGTKDGKVTITFTYTGTDTTNGYAAIYYGLYVAKPGEVPDQLAGKTNGANAWSGGSLQTTVEIGGSGATSLQLAPSAIIAGEISGYKWNDLNANGTWQQPDEPGLAGWKIYLDNDTNLGNGTLQAVTTSNGTTDDQDADGTIDPVGFYYFSVTPDADKGTPSTNNGYYVYEASQAGWTQTAPTPIPPGAYGPLVVSAATPTYLNKNIGNTQSQRTVGLQGYKWHDLNGDGVWDGRLQVGGEPGLVDWTVYIDLTGNGLTVDDPSGLTDDSGQWIISNANLELDQVYVIRELNQPGWIQSYPSPNYPSPAPYAEGVYKIQVGATSNIIWVDSNNNNTLDSGESALPSPASLDYGNYKPLLISGLKYTDANGDGSLLGDSPGTPGQAFTIDLYTFTDIGADGIADDGETLSLVTSTETNATTGAWSFSDLGPLGANGYYLVKEAGESGWTQTFGKDGYSVAATSGNDDTSGNNFGNFDNLTISGLKYTDANGDGSLLGDSPGTPGQAFTIDLYKFTDIGADGIADDGEVLSLVTSTETNATTGAWSFSDLGPLGANGYYLVKEAGESGWMQTFGKDGYSVAATSGNDDTSGNNFGNFDNLTISGLKYTDANGDGSLLGDSPGTPGQAFTIDLYTFTDIGADGIADDGETLSLVTSTETNATTGAWSFSNLGPLGANGYYLVKEAGESGWTQTFGKDGYSVAATSGNDDTSGNNFGNFDNLTISGLKYTDANGDGSLLGDSPGTPGQAFTIDLYTFTDIGADGIADDGETLSLVTSTETNASTGAWSFSNLGPLGANGYYLVKEAGESGWTQTFGKDGYSVAATSGNDDTSGNNFGNFDNLTISGLKYTDANGDGSLLGDSPGTPGQSFTIDLYTFTDIGADGIADDGETLSLVTSTETNASTGAWSFSNLGPLGANGYYLVKEAGESGWTQTFGKDGYSVAATSGNDDTSGNNFGNFDNLTISGLKYTDANGDGSLLGDSPGTPGQSFTIDLYTFTDIGADGIADDGETLSLVTSTETNASTGAWSFSNLGPLGANGYYLVKEAGESGWTQTFGKDGYSVAATSGNDDTSGNNFGNFDNLTISGLKYTDANGDGSLLGDSPGTPGQAFTIDLYTFTDIGADGIADDGETLSLVTSTETNASTGAWSFSNLGPLGANGYYLVKEAGESGWTQTFGKDGYSVAATSGNDDTSGNNFGNFDNLTISGLKYTDANGDGSLLGDSPGTPGQAFTIDLYTFTDIGADGIADDGETLSLVTSTETNASTGAWSFSNLGPLGANGYYLVKEAGESGWTQTFGKDGYSVAATSGNDDTSGNNFGNFDNLTISGLKYTDANGDGSLLGDSPGTPGQSFTIDLYTFTDIGADGIADDGETLSLVTSTETNASTGAWSFSNLGPLGANGYYLVKEAGESGWTQTFGKDGYSVAATSGNDDTSGNNFGNFDNLTISGLKYTDANGDGSLLGDSPGTPGQAFTIDLYTFTDIGADGIADDGETLSLVTSTETNASTGAWSFSNLGPLGANGYYLVKEAGESGWTQTFGKDGYSVAATSGNDDTSGNNFGNFDNLTISGLKYTDANGDGSLLGDSPGTPGQAFTIDLYTFTDIGADGIADDGETLSLVTSTETNASTGAWSFSNLGPLGANGYYLVKEAGESGWTQTFGKDGYSVAATSGNDDTSGNNFGNFDNLTISGLKYTDANGDGSLLGDSPGTPGQSFTIDLYTFTDIGADGIADDGETLSLVTSTETNASTGAWSFSNLGPLGANGYYLVKEAGESGWTQTFGKDGYSVAATSGNDDTSGNNFGNFDNLTISGLKYTDANGDGSLLGDSPGTPGQAFTIDLYTFTDIGADGIADDGETLSLVTSTETNASTGAWSFSNLGPLGANGYYLVKEAGESGWTQTFGKDGYSVAATSGNDDTSGNNFGNFDNLTISGLKYTDANGDGSLLGDSPGTPGQAFTIDLYTFTDIGADGIADDGETLSLVTSTETNASTGAWSFSNLGPLGANGYYLVKEAGESGWTQTFGKDGYSVAATSGNDDTSGNNFGNFDNLTISGLKYTDANGDGSLLGDSPGTPGQAFTIDLYTFTDIGADGIADDGETLSLVTSTETNATTGAWSFSNLGPLGANGYYLVKEAGESGWTQTFGKDGYSVAATSGNDDTSGNNFGNTADGSIHGFKFDDVNGDGAFNLGDAAQAGVVFTLSGNGITPIVDTTDANGYFDFTSLKPGTYSVTETPPSADTVATVDHDGNGVGDFITTVTITSGQEKVAKQGQAGALPAYQSEVVVGNQLTFGNFEEKVCALTPGFWSQHLWAWDGNPQTDGQVDKQGRTLASKLVAAGTLTKEDVLVDPAGLKLDNRLFFSLKDAQDIINAGNQLINGDQRVKLSRHAIATQLNDFNGAPNPNNILKDATDWLTALSPYVNYPDGSTGDVDANNDNIADFNNTVESGADGFAGVKLAADKQAWQGYPAGTNSGSEVFNALVAYNENCNGVSSGQGQLLFVSDNEADLIVATKVNNGLGLGLLAHRDNALGAYQNFF